MPISSPQDGYLVLTYQMSKTASDVTFTVQCDDVPDGDSWVTVTMVIIQSDQGTHWLITVRDTVPLAGHPHTASCVCK